MVENDNNADVPEPTPVGVIYQNMILTLMNYLMLMTLVEEMISLF